MNPNQMLLSALALFLGLLSQQIVAQEKHPLARFLDTNTIAYARVDIESFEPQSVYDQFLPVIKEFDRLNEKVELTKSLVIGTRSKLMKAGVTEIYGFFSLSDLNSGAFFVIPCDDKNALEVESLINLLTKQQRRAVRDLKASRIPEGVLLATEHTTKRLANGFLPARKDATEVLNLASQSFDIVVAPSQDQLKAIRECLAPPYPQFAGKIFSEGGLDGELIADGMRRTILSFDAASTQLSVKIQGIEECPPGEEKRREATVKLAKKLNWFLAQLQTGQAPFFPQTKRMGLLPPKITSTLNEIEITQIDHEILITIDRENLIPLASGLAEWTEVQLGLTQLAHHRNACRTILLATHNFESAFAKFPPKNIVDDNGKPLLSWRVAILPFMGDEAFELYKKFKLNEPWDSEHNKKLVLEIPDVFATNSDLANSGKTIWTIPQGDGFIGDCTRFGQIVDGTSNTILLVKVDSEHAMAWSQPVDFEPNPDAPQDGIFSVSDEIVVIGMADGSVHNLPADITNEILLALLTFAGGEVIGNQ